MLRMTLLAVALLLPTACASGGGSTTSGNDTGTDAASSSLRVNVQNDHAAANTIVVFIEPVGAGVRRSLGTVEGGRNQTFTFAATPGGQYILIAQTTSGETRSDRFSFNAPTTVTWDMSGPRLMVVRR